MNNHPIQTAVGEAVQASFEFYQGEGDAGARVLRERGDITSGRHKDSPTSVAANKVVRKDIDRQKVLETIRTLGTATLKEVCDVLGKYPNQISGRFTALRIDGLIEYVGEEVREGCRVYRIRK